MASCNIPYIRQATLSDTEKSRLEEIHISIFKQAKESKAFREVNNRLQIIKAKYAEATSFVGRVNQQNEAKIAVLSSIGGGNAVLNVNVLPLSKEAQGELLLQEPTMSMSIASLETLKKVKEVINRMGIDLQDLTTYAKSFDYDIKGVGGVADLTRGIIAIAEGREGQALTEEMVHVATSILEQANPKSVTEMIAKIDRFKIYKETLENYKGDKRYQLPDGKVNIRKIKKEAVDKLIAEVIINKNEILDWIKRMYRSTNISIFEQVAEQIIEGKIRTPGEGEIPQQILDELNSFVLYENREMLCPSGICNFTAKRSTEKLKQVGLNPYPNWFSGSSLAVSVGSPVGDFNITHYVAATAIGNSIYIYDMPQNEFINEDVYGTGDVSLKKSFRPRLIPLTKDEIKANYNLSDKEALNFIRSILNARGSNKGSNTEILPFEDYIKQNIPDAEEYITELKREITDGGLLESAFEEYQIEDAKRVAAAREEKKREIDDIKAAVEGAKKVRLTPEETLKVERLLQTKLKLRTREYVPRTKAEFNLAELVKNVIGNNSFEYDYEEGLPTALSKLGDYLKSDTFVESVWRNYTNAKSEVENSDKIFESIFYRRRLVLGFLKRAKTGGWNNTLNKYDETQKTLIRSAFDSNIKEVYPSEAQRINVLSRRYTDINEFISSMGLGKMEEGEKEKESRIRRLSLQRFMAAKKLEKAKTILNFLKMSEFDTEYIHRVISNEANRKYKPFKERGELFFQLSDDQTPIVKKLQDTKAKVEKVVETTTPDPLLLDSEEANNFYRIQKEDGTWEKVVKRVTDRVKAWYKERFGTKIFTAEEKKFNELKRKFGVEGHADFEEIHSRYYNKDGTKRDKPLVRVEKFKLPSQDMYDKLERYYVDLVNSFKAGTLILSEVVIYDEKQKEAGTIDFLAIEDSGKTHIFDWKFMSINKGQEDVAWYKQGAYNIQIGRYKDILRANYGVKEFGMMRAIPILMDFKPQDPKVKTSPMVLKGIAIGTMDVSKIKTLTLLPVAEESESTGYDVLDNIIKKLNAHMRQISKERASTEEERQFKFERLNILNRAIRQAHITNNIAPLVDVIEVMRKEGDRIMEDYTTSYKDRPASSEDSKDSELSDFSEDMRDYIKLSDIFINIGRQLGPLIYTEEMSKSAKTDPEKEEALQRKEILNKLRTESDAIYTSRESILNASMAFADKHIGERNLVTGLLKPEKIVKGLGSLFRGVSDLPLRSLEILHKLTRSAQGKASEDALGEITSLIEIRKKLAERGGNLRDLVKQVYQKDEKGGIVNKLIYKYDENFRKEMDKKAAEGGDIKWLKENINLAAYKEEADKIIKRQTESIKKNRYSGSKEEEEEAREKEIEKIERQYDIDNKHFNGWNNYILKRHPLEKWFSKEYEIIRKDADLLNLYNFIVKFNEKAKDVGYIDNRVTSFFLPFVRKTMAEQIAFDGNLSVMQKFQQELELKIDDTGYGNINEVTGELENSIPKYYTHDFTYQNGVNDYSDVSEDLFKNLILYIQQVEKYKYMSEVEGQLKLIKTIEEFKNHLNTGRSGDIVVKDGHPQELPGNAENAKMYDDFLRVLLYDQRYVLSDTDTPLNIGKVVNFVKSGVNRVAGKEVWAINENPTPTSLIKSIDAINRGFQIKTLGFDFISGAVNWFGGNIQAATQAGAY